MVYKEAEWLTTNENYIKPEIVADSISKSRKRITTFVLTYPRFIHSELMTHRVFSRNAMSSRAVPVEKMIELVQQKTAHPIHWGKNQPGMQANHEHDEDVVVDLSWILGGLNYTLTRNEAWNHAMMFACTMAKGFADAGYHKQIVNRLIEPYQLMRTVVTSTEWDNWYWLRDHEDAQPEIRELASQMLNLHNSSSPNVLDNDEWHIPFYKNGVWTPHHVNDEMVDVNDYTVSDALKISASCCAQASFRNNDESLEKAQRVWDRLVGSVPKHSSPFEHQAKPMTNKRGTSLSSRDLKQSMKIWNKGVTHTDISGDAWSGNFKGWIQHRQLFNDHTCNDYEKLKK